MAERQHIVHSIPPTYDERSRVLVLGSLPSPASRELGFNYGHPRNRFWPVMAQLAGEPVPATNERKRDFCLRHHIALWDVVGSCDIVGASDASIENAVPNRLTDITESSPIEAVFCTGAKAHELYNRLCLDEVGIPAVKLPSTSPANAACKMERLLVEYAAIFEHEHRFEPPTLDVPEVVGLEQAAAAAGTSLFELMDRAGGAVAWRVEGMIGEMRDDVRAGGSVSAAPEGEGVRDEARGDGPLVLVMCGNGNNGGDGWVASALLAQASVAVCVLTSKLPDQLTAQPARDAALKALDVLEACGAQLVPAESTWPSGAASLSAVTPLIVLDDGRGADRQLVSAVAQRADIVVDAILGTGGARELREPFLGWARAVNAAAGNHRTLAVDIPTGVSARTGEVADSCIRADETLTMIVPKPGLAAPECGRVRVAPLVYIEPLLGEALVL